MAFRVMKSVKERAPAARRGPLQLWPEHSSAGMREAPDAGKDRRKAVSSTTAALDMGLGMVCVPPARMERPHSPWGKG